MRCQRSRRGAVRGDARERAGRRPEAGSTSASDDVVIHWSSSLSRSRGRGVNHLAIAVGIPGPALEEARGRRRGPVAVDRSSAAVASRRQLPDADQVVAGGGLGELRAWLDRDRAGRLGCRTSTGTRAPAMWLTGGGALPDLVGADPVVGRRELLDRIERSRRVDRPAAPRGCARRASPESRQLSRVGGVRARQPPREPLGDRARRRRAARPRGRRRRAPPRRPRGGRRRAPRSRRARSRARRRWSHPSCFR